MPSPTLFYEPKFASEQLWDTWLYYHNDLFYLYYMTGPVGGWNGIAMATSPDGIHWREFGKILEPAAGVFSMGAGSVWETGKAADDKKFVMNFCETRGLLPDSRTTISFAESRDLIHWTRLDSSFDFRPDDRWYRPNGRWDNIWTLPRPGGGFYGYWAATSKKATADLGFGESLDGITWKALEPRALLGLIESPEVRALSEKAPEIGAICYRSPEIGAIYNWKGMYYAMLGLNDLEPTLDSIFRYRPGETTFVANSALGPFSPAPKNRRLLIGNASYFSRFLDTPDGVLVNYHSWAWETNSSQPLGVTPGRVYMAPLKRANWDDEGTLRLMWWDGYERAKGKPLQIEFTKSTERMTQLSFGANPETQGTLILEGRIFFPASANMMPIGLYFQIPCDASIDLFIQKTAFLVHKNGMVEYGLMLGEGLHFEKEGEVDRELTLQDSVRFRLVQKGRITEFYLDDFLMHCYALPEQSFGQLGLFGPLNCFGDLTAWYV